jgi:acyl-CoA thioester hydrolase
LLRASDGCLLAKARTVWCPIDAVTGKPTGVSAAVRAAFSVATEGKENQPPMNTDEHG